MPRYISPVSQQFDGDGNTVPGARLAFFESGTSTPKTTYTDHTLTSANTNPVVSDSAGVFPDIWLEDGYYKAELSDAAGAIIWTRDNIGLGGGIGVVRAVDYGVRADGVSDDAAGLTTALEAAAGRLLELPSGVIAVSDGIEIPSGTVVSGRGTTIQAMSGLTGSIVLANEGSTLLGLTIDGNQWSYTTSPTQFGLQIAGDGVVLDGVTVKNTLTQGLRIDGAAHGRVIGCAFDDNAGLGMEMVSGAYWHFVACSFDRNGYGFQQTKSSPTDYSHLFVAFGAAVRHRSHHVDFANCRANDNGRDGFNVNQGSYAVKFTACQALRNDDGGFTLAADDTSDDGLGDGEGCWDIEYVDCEAANNYSSGIAAYAPAFRIQVIGGRYYDNGRVAGREPSASSYGNGIYFAAGCRSISIRGVLSYNDRPTATISTISYSPAFGVVDWIVEGLDYFNCVAVYSSSGVFKGYATVTTEQVDPFVSVTLEPTDHNGIVLADIVVGDRITTAIQHTGVFFDNGCTGVVDGLHGWGHRVGPLGADLQGRLLTSGMFSGSPGGISITGNFVFGGDLVTNGSFDADISTGWSYALGGGAAAHVTSGARSPGALRLTAGAGETYAAQSFTPVLDMARGAFLRFGAWVKASSIGTVRFAVYVFDPAVKTHYIDHPGDDKWHYMEVNLQIASSDTAIEIRLLSYTSAVAYFDTIACNIIDVNHTTIPQSRYFTL